MKTKHIKERIESTKRELRRIEECPLGACKAHHDYLLGFLAGLEYALKERWE